MRNKEKTFHFYTHFLGFKPFGDKDFDGYLMLQKDGIQIHFFEFKGLDPLQNYGQVYIRTNNVKALYEELQSKQTPIHPNGAMEIKPWGQIEFSLLDPDHNLLTFGQTVWTNKSLRATTEVQTKR